LRTVHRIIARSLSVQGSATQLASDAPMMTF
jgi:hypothetical protein